MTPIFIYDLVNGFDDTIGILTDYAGVRHAAYPTAARTLCGELVSGLIARDLVPSWPPACAPCRESAEKIDAVDHSAPAAWFRSTPGKGPALCQGTARSTGLPCRDVVTAGETHCRHHKHQEVVVA